MILAFDVTISPNVPVISSVVAGDASATVTVADGTGGGGAASSFTVSEVGDATRFCTITLPAESCVLSGLANGRSYTFTATATNDGGTSGASDPSGAVTPVATVIPVPPVPPVTPAGEPTSTATSSAGPSSSPVAPVLRQSAPQQQGDSVITTGSVPDGATSVVQIATRVGSKADRARSATRVSTTCAIIVKGSTRTYRCSVHLPGGRWTLTTQAKAGTKVVARSVKQVAVKPAPPKRAPGQQMRPEPVTG